VGRFCETIVRRTVSIFYITARSNIQCSKRRTERGSRY